MKPIGWYSAEYGGPKGKGKKLAAPCPTCYRPLAQQGKRILCPHCGFECTRMRVFILPDEHMEPLAAIFCWAATDGDVKLHIAFVAAVKAEEMKAFWESVITPMATYWMGRLVKHGLITEEQATAQLSTLLSQRPKVRDAGECGEGASE